MSEIRILIGKQITTSAASCHKTSANWEKFQKNHLNKSSGTYPNYCVLHRTLLKCLTNLTVNCISQMLEERAYLIRRWQRSTALQCPGNVAEAGRHGASVHSRGIFCLSRPIGKMISTKWLLLKLSLKWAVCSCKMTLRSEMPILKISLMSL